MVLTFYVAHAEERLARVVGIIPSGPEKGLPAEPRLVFTDAVERK